MTRMAISPNIQYNEQMSESKSYLSELEDESKSLLVSAIASKLKLSVEERIDSHENSRQLISDLSNAPKDLSAGSQEAS